jgi:hypothetical protein
MRTVVTAIFQGYERPKAPPPGVDRAVMLTDDSQDDRWQIIRRKDHGIGPRRLFFTAKLTPHIMIADGDDVLWIDGSMEPKEVCDLDKLFSEVQPGGVGIYEHHGRDGYWAEAEFSKAVYGPGGGQDRGLLAMDQAAHYRDRGCPPLGKVWATGIIVWRGAQRRLGERWLAEVMSWSASDQVALPWLVHLGYEVTTLAGDVYENPYFQYVGHGQVGRTTRI